MFNIAYVKVGRSSNWARKRMNWVKNGSVSLVVPMEIELASVPTPTTILKMKSIMERPLFIAAAAGGAFEPSPISTDFIFIWLFLSKRRGINLLRREEFDY